MGAWPAEIRQRTIAHQLRDIALDAIYLAGYRILVKMQDVTHVLGIEAGCELRRSHEVDEQHRQLSALWAASRDQFWGCGPGKRPIQPSYRLKDRLAVAERCYSNFPEVLTGDGPQQAPIDMVFSKQLNVLREPKLSQPVTDVYCRIPRRHAELPFYRIARKLPIAGDDHEATAAPPVGRQDELN
jgi:hypothetical protein